MSDHKQKQPRKNNTSRKDSKKSKRFLEELSWLLDTYSDVDFRALAQFAELLDDRPNFEIDQLRHLIASDSNKQLLVGLLPGMFTDRTLFPTNEDIADFSREALNVRIPRWTKKSKFELIGHIVCHTATANDKRLTKLARALSYIAVGDVRLRNLIAHGRRQKKNWNEIIQDIVNRY